MDRFTRIGGHDPLTVVELITALFLVVGGLYLLSYLAISTVELGLPNLALASQAIQSLASKLGLGILGGAATIIGSVHTWAIFRYNYKVRSWMIFSHVMVRLYTIIAVILVQGILPLEWLNSFVICLILCVCYVTNRRKIRFLREVKG